MQGLQSAIATYGDHRMAMAFAPWGLLQPVHIENPDVVVKSYPQFWQHVTDIGFDLQFS
jgi:3-phosphoshikimate 1-carboxyvinyltransferase